MVVTLAKLLSKLPRGGWALVRWLPARSAALPTIAGPIWCDISEVACYPLLKYGFYPHTTVEVEWMRQAAKAGDLVLDIGANVGFTASIFAATGARVVAFEPAPRAYRLLSKTAEGRFEARNIALSDRPGSLRFSERESFDLSAVSPEGGIEVPATTIDALDLAPTLIKIDVEGHEPLILRGAVETLRRSRPTVMFEALSADMLSECAAALQEAVPGYQISVLNDCNYVARVA